MSKCELVKRYLLLIISLFLAAVGVVLIIKTQLGNSPAASVIFVLTLSFPVLSLGGYTIAYNYLLLTGQILLKQRKFQKIQLLQIPLSLVLGVFSDFAVWLFAWLNPTGYVVRLGILLFGCAVLGLSATLSLMANVVMNSGEAFVKALSEKLGKDFSRTKVFFDVGQVLVTVVFSLLFLHQICGVREGTVIAAITVGNFVKLFSGRLKWINCFLEKSKAE